MPGRHVVCVCVRLFVCLFVCFHRREKRCAETTKCMHKEHTKKTHKDELAARRVVSVNDNDGNKRERIEGGSDSVAAAREERCGAGDGVCARLCAKERCLWEREKRKDNDVKQ